MAINNIRKDKTHTGVSPDVRYRKTCAIYSAPPVIINAEPTAMDDLGHAVLMGDIELLLPDLIAQSES